VAEPGFAAPGEASAAGETLRIAPPRPNRLQRLVQHLAAARPLAWLAARLLHRLDKAHLRASGDGRVFAEYLVGVPVIMLTTTGAKSGLPRTMPLLALPADERIILFGTNFGQGHHPAWVHNLRAHPRAIVTYRGQSAPYVAREATEEERTWAMRTARRVYVVAATYLRRANTRKVPVIVLEPSAINRQPSASPANAER
jgi:deazaflavin-dependent oxidoreductase (nitroreductase family)